MYLLCLLLLKQASVSYGDQHIAGGYKKNKDRLEGDRTLGYFLHTYCKFPVEGYEGKEEVKGKYLG